MKAQLSLPIDEPTIETVAREFPEDGIYYLVLRGLLSEYTADHAIKQQRKSS